MQDPYLDLTRTIGSYLKKVMVLNLASYKRTVSIVVQTGHSHGDFESFVIVLIFFNSSKLTMKIDIEKRFVYYTKG